MAVAETKVAGAPNRDSVGEDIAREIRELRDDIAALTKSMREYGDLSVHEVRGRVADLSEEAVEDALLIVRELRQRLDGVEKKLEGNVREHPLSWLVAALGLGLLAGHLFARRD